MLVLAVAVNDLGEGPGRLKFFQSFHVTIRISNVNFMNSFNWKHKLFFELCVEVFYFIVVVVAVVSI